MREQYVLLEGEVLSIGERSLRFQQEGGTPAFFVPLNQIRNVATVEIGDPAIEITKWIFRKLTEEGKL